MGPKVCHISLLKQKYKAQNILADQFQLNRKIKVSELKQIDTVVGDGQEAAEGNHVDVHYTGWLYVKRYPITRARNSIALLTVANSLVSL